MTHRAPGGRRLDTGALARVEGEGGMHVEIVDGRVVSVQLSIYEPPRFFEGFLRGRAYTEPPDITARICGICPVAYQMSACVALEDACGATVPEPLGDLRRLLYCGEWIESHTLHIHLLHAPDFLGVDSAIEMAARHRAEVERGLTIKKIGNELLELLGGRAVHPVNVKVGGFYRAPTRAELAPLRARLDHGRDLAADAVRWVASLPRPHLDSPHELVSLDHPDHYPVFGDRIVSTRGLDIDVAEFPDHVVESHVEHSTAKHAHLLERGEFQVGPLARFAQHAEKLSPAAAEVAREVGLDPGERNQFASIVVRAVEVLHAFDTAVAIIDGYVEPDEPAIAVPPRAATGHGATEAPRGLLYHRYTLEADGTIAEADIVPPTSQNQPAIEHDLWHFVEANVDLDDETLGWQSEMAIRNYDPCISCSAHFLDLTVERSGRPVVIGVGNRWRGDDAVGPLVIDALGDVELTALELADVELVELDGEPSRLLDAWDGASLAVVVDAAVTDAPPGTVGVIVVGDEPGADPLPDAPRTSASSHATGVAEAVALGRELGRLPTRLVVVTITGAGFDLGAPPTDAVAGAVDAAAQVVVAQLSKRQGPVTS